MLKHFDAAFTSASRVQSLDPLASLAEGFLDVHAVLIVQASPCFAILGASDGANALDEAMMQRARRAPHADLSGLFADAVTVHGTRIEGPPPFGSLLKLPVRSDAVEYATILFPHSGGVELGRLKRFDRAARRHIAEHRLLERYRADLKRFVGLFETIQRTARIGVWEEAGTDEDVLYWSDGVYRIFDLPANEPPPSRHLDHFPEPGRTELAVSLARTRASGLPTDLTLAFVSAKKQRRMVRVIAHAQPQTEGAATLHGTAQDVTALSEATEKLWWSANHDALTRLPNRALFSDRFRKALQRCERTKKLLAVMLVDVDDFKQVNDSLGHAAGDELLKRVSETLRTAVRTTDTVARTGGDEFCVLMEDIDTLHSLHSVLDRLSRSLEIRLVWRQSVMVVSLSAGVALAPQHGRSETELLAAADTALYRMKAQSGPALALYEAPEGAETAENERIVKNARAALIAGDIQPYYQPQVDLTSGRVVAVEALARWQVRSGPTLTAAEFADALDDPLVGPQISESVAQQAIAEMAAFNRERETKLALSVNANPDHILSGHFLDAVVSARNAAGPDNVPLTVELAEAQIRDRLHGHMVDQMHRAHERGIGFSLVDCDARLDTILRVRHLPIDEVKTKRAFIRELTRDAGKQDAMEALISLAKSLRMRVVVQGVETAAQAVAIERQGSALGQGYHFSEAVPIAELAGLADYVYGAADEGGDASIFAA